MRKFTFTEKLDQITTHVTSKTIHAHHWLYQLASGGTLLPDGGSGDDGGSEDDEAEASDPGDFSDPALRSSGGA